MESLEDLIFSGSIKRALIIGIGGGGDVLSTLPTMRYLELHKIEVLIGGITWERITVDPKPGPRSLDEFTNIKRISETVAFASHKTKTTDGIFPQPCRLSAFLGKEVLLIDPSKGEKGLSRGLTIAINELKLDIIIGLDGGGDVLAKGDEKGLQSPLADSLMLASLANVSKIPTVIGVFGFGSDGELNQQQILTRLSEIASKGGYLGARGLTPKDAMLMEKAVKYVTSEASFLPVMAAKGKMGRTKIREGTREVYLSILSTLTIYLDAKILYDSSPIAKAVTGTNSIYEAKERLNEMGLFTELDFELIAKKLGTTSYTVIRDYIRTHKIR